MLIRAREEPLERAIDELGLLLLQDSVAKAKLVHGARPEVLGQHVGALDEFQRHGASGFRFEIDGNALLVAVEGRKEPRAGRRELARMIAVQGLDLDHFRTKIGEHKSAGGPHYHVHELDYAYAFQR